MRRHRCVPPGRSPGELLLAVILALLAPVLTAAPAAATPPDDPADARVVATDQVLIWDGAGEVFAVRWHLSAPVTRLDWLVATPGPARPVQLGDRTLATLAAEAEPRQRWYVTHPWLLFDDAGRQAVAHLATPAAPDGAAPAVGVTALDGTGSALAAAETVGALDDVTRRWVRAAVQRGWTVHRVTARTATPSTLVGPVAVSFGTDRPLVPSSPLPRHGRASLITVAPTVLAAEQPDLAAAAGPPFTVENARTLRVPLGDLDGRTSPSGQWVVTALSGRAPAVEPAVLAPQDGPTVDWRSQVGIWWPGWGPVAVGALTVALVLGLAAVAARRRPARAARTVVTVPAQRLQDTRELAPVDDVLVDTRPDIHPVP